MKHLLLLTLIIVGMGCREKKSEHPKENQLPFNAGDTILMRLYAGDTVAMFSTRKDTVIQYLHFNEAGNRKLDSVIKILQDNGINVYPKK